MVGLGALGRSATVVSRCGRPWESGVREPDRRLFAIGLDRRLFAVVAVGRLAPWADFADRLSESPWINQRH